MSETDHERRLSRAEANIREHDIAIAGIQTVQTQLQADQAKLTEALDKLMARIREDEEATAAYRMGQEFRRGRTMGIGLVIVTFIGAVGSAVSNWLLRVLGQ